MATGTGSARKFVSFDEARAAVLARASLPSARMPAEAIALDDALGRTLRGEVLAHEPFPRFDNSAMDGFALRAADVAGASPSAPATLAVIETLAAGSVAGRAVARGEAIRIMTGAPLPAGADAVVPIEQTSSSGEDDAATVDVLAAVASGENVRPAGEDFPVGERLLASGAVLGPGAIAVLAALGHAEVDVALPPRVAILSTGDELVPPGQPVGPGQIRDSNAHMMRALVRAAGGEPGPCWHLTDDPAAVTAAVARVADHCDAIVTLGGVSAGDFDPVRSALGALGALGGDVSLWRVGMRPGQPQAFGTVHGRLFFGLPGNPVSSAVVFEMLVRPALWTMMGRAALDRPTVRAVLAEPVASKAGRRDFLRVTLEELAPGQAEALHAPYRAHLTGSQSSGAISSVLKAAGLAVIPDEVEGLSSGSPVTVLVFGGSLPSQ